MVDLGYEAIMKTATESPRAVLEAMPGRSNMSAAAAAIELENIRARVFFGAFEKVGFLNNLCGLKHTTVRPF